MATTKSGILSDIDIREHFDKEIKIYTEYKTGDLMFNLDSQLQPASIDLRFRNEGKRFKRGLSKNINFEMLKSHEYTDPFEIPTSEKLIINPGEIIFTTTLETIVITKEFAGFLTGRSSFARLGIMVHCCQEFINPGQCAPIALQIVNLGEYPVELDMRIPICQLVLFKLNSPASESYSKKNNSKYKDETSFIPSRIYEEQKSNDIVTKTNINSKHNFKKIKRFLKKYISPFIPSIIMLLLVKPILESSSKMTVLSFFSKLLDTPLSIVIIIICIFIFIFAQRIDKE